MPFFLRRSSDADLVLTSEHETIAKPRKTDIHWDAFATDDFTPTQLDAAARDWRERALQEFHSLALFTQLTTQIHRLGAPLDWSGAFARMIADEVRHTDLCLKFCEKLGRPNAPLIQDDELHLDPTTPLLAHVRTVVIAAFCIGETLSGRMFKRSLQSTTVPLAREVVAAIVVDESFHESLGWELAALLMREIIESERESLAADLPALFAHYARLCGAMRGPVWAKSEPESDSAPNFGTLTHAGYARAFFDGMVEDVVPGLVALGFPEATRAYDELVVTLSPEGLEERTSVA